MEHIKKLMEVYLKRVGLITPETEEEIQAIIDQIGAENTKRADPDEAIAILRRGYTDYAPEKQNNAKDIIPYSLVARKMKEIPEEIIKLMKSDRENVEKDNKKE